MRPDSPLSPNNNPSRSYPSQPIRRPMQDFGGRAVPQPMQDFSPPQPVPQRPVNDFNPRPAPGAPVNNYAPRPASPQPANNFQPYVQTQQRPQSAQPAQPEQRTPLTFEAPKIKQKKGKKVLAAVAMAVLLAAAGFLFIAGGNDSGKPSVKAQSSQPSVKPFEKPNFTVYYPNPMPAGLKAARGSISYYNNSFTFILEQNGQKSFFVYEQPASTDPEFNSLKSKLAAPKAIALTTGKGVEGGLDNGTVTAVKTDKNTIIIINCTKAVCSTLPRDLLSSMQLNTDLDGLRKNN
jgi:hypothetical protein